MENKKFYPIYMFANDLFTYFNKLGKNLDKIIKEYKDFIPPENRENLFK
jgi:hypothetical protein